MAAYAALVSLMNLIEQIQKHPQPPITLDKEQARSLTEKIVYLQEFLETYNSHYANQEVERLRNRIADAAYAAEDIIESCVVNQIIRHSPSHDGEHIISLRDMFEGYSHGGSKETDGLQTIITESNLADQLRVPSKTQFKEKIRSIKLYHALQEMIQHIDSIKKEVMEVIGKIGSDENQLQRIITRNAVSSEFPSERSTMVGFDDVLYKMLDKLTRKHSGLPILPISGMGGIGKTTLAKNVYKHPFIEQHFHVRAWVTISQEYSLKEILLQVLLCLNQGNKGSLSQKSEQDLGLQLYKSLIGRRYLIIMDDVWSVEAWDKVKFFFPDNNNGSAIVITTRLSNLVFSLTNCYGIEMHFLDQENSWKLLCKTVFGEEHCPPELKYTGMVIAKNCLGLPLSIVVIGGLLAKSKRTRSYWESIAENLSSVVNLEDNERCLKILRTSYDKLPVHLKACFLYMGIFPEDSIIRVSEITKLWVSEGFLKPSRAKSLKEIAEEYLIDLIDRNLIIVNKYGFSGKAKFCNIHDLLRDLCLREAHIEQFWKMPLLRHLKFKIISGPDDFVSGKSFPNAKKLKLYYTVEGESNYHLDNFDCLHKLEFLNCSTFDHYRSRSCDLLNSLSFPSSLKKLTLCYTFLHSEDMRAKIGSLPLLEVLKLDTKSFIGSTWEAVEGQFLSLKYLRIFNCYNLECLVVESSHFPRLEHLVLLYLPKLNEIPQDIGEIPTLKSIQMEYCNDSAIISATRILEEQEELGNEGIQVQVWLSPDNDQHLKSLASYNFQVHEGTGGRIETLTFLDSKDGTLQEFPKLCKSRY